MARLSPGCRRAGHGVGGRALRVLRAVCARADPNDQRPEGQKGWHLGPRLRQVLVPCGSWCPSRSRPQQGHQMGHEPHSQAGGALSRLARSVDAFLGFPPEPQELRARGIGRVIVDTTTDSRGRSISAAPCSVTKSSSAIIRSRPSGTCVPSSRPPISAPPSPERAARGLVDAGFTPRYDYALQTLTEVAVRQVARVRPGGLAAVLRASAPRGRHDQLDPAGDHRRGHRLALPQRDQARAEGVSHADGRSGWQC